MLFQTASSSHFV